MTLPPLLDSESVQTLKELGAETFAEIVAAFEKNSGRLLTRLEAAAQAGDLVAAKGAIHSLVSSVGAVGATRLAGLYRDIEVSVPSNSVEDLRRFAESVQGTLDLVLAELKAHQVPQD